MLVARFYFFGNFSLFLPVNWIEFLYFAPPRRCFTLLEMSSSSNNGFLVYSCSASQIYFISDYFYGMWTTPPNYPIKLRPCLWWCTDPLYDYLECLKTRNAKKVHREQGCHHLHIVTVGFMPCMYILIK